MTREAIKKRLAGIREQKIKILEMEAKYEGLELEADEAAAFKIIHKERIQPEDIEFLVSLSEEEIRMIIEMRSSQGSGQDKLGADGEGTGQDPDDGPGSAALPEDGADGQENINV